MKKIIAIHAGPRTGMNTDQLIKEAIKGVESKGAEVEYISLYRLEKYTGCISCFACKLPRSYGKCAYHDGLYDVLEKIRNADGIIVGSPNYLGNLTASFRALYERLVFQSLTYNKEEPNCNKHMIPVLLIATSNCGEEAYDNMGYTAMLDSYKNTLNHYVGPTKILICGNTLQTKNYDMFNWTMFDGKKKQEYHDQTFHQYLEKAYEMGKGLLIED